MHFNSKSPFDIAYHSASAWHTHPPPPPASPRTPPKFPSTQSKRPAACPWNFLPRRRIPPARRSSRRPTCPLSASYPARRPSPLVPARTPAPAAATVRPSPTPATLPQSKNPFSDRDTRKRGWNGRCCGRRLGRGWRSGMARPRCRDRPWPRVACRLCRISWCLSGARRGWWWEEGVRPKSGSRFRCGDAEVWCGRWRRPRGCAVRRGGGEVSWRERRSEAWWVGRGRRGMRTEFFWPGNRKKVVKTWRKKTVEYRKKSNQSINRIDQINQIHQSTNQSNPPINRIHQSIESTNQSNDQSIELTKKTSVFRAIMFMFVLMSNKIRKIFLWILSTLKKTNQILLWAGEILWFLAAFSPLQSLKQLKTVQILCSV